VSSNGGGSGLLASLRRLVATTLEIAQVRIELLAVEVEQEKLRIFDALAWAALALLLLGVGLTLAVVLLLMLFWEGYRLAALAVLCVLFLAGGAMVARVARARLINPAGHAAVDSLDELKQDRDALVGRQ
jgi:uncharacterized membrane protein YqjE